MFREMRRKNQKLSETECEEILMRATSGVLALSGDDGYPYAVPLSFLYENGKIYFHGAKSGHKLDAVARCDKASFCVIDLDRVVPEKFTAYFRSVIAFGRIRRIDDPEQMRRIVDALAIRYAPLESDQSRSAEIDREFPGLCVLELTVEHISGKEAIELVRKRKQKEKING